MCVWSVWTSICCYLCVCTHVSLSPSLSLSLPLSPSLSLSLTLSPSLSLSLPLSPSLSLSLPLSPSLSLWSLPYTSTVPLSLILFPLSLHLSTFLPPCLNLSPSLLTPSHLHSITLTALVKNLIKEIDQGLYQFFERSECEDYLFCHRYTNGNGLCFIHSS